tara:strand:+ start:404 stop:835 length:432 start_codon:yes stop_codon:yes gene_type:complete
MNIYIGNDHAGVDFKNLIKEFLVRKGYTVINRGTNNNESVDYPDFIHPVAEDVCNNKNSFGIIICGSGNGAAITANKHQKIRAALCWNNKIAELSRKHNNANIISIPARFIKIKQALQMIEVFLKTAFEGGRHEKRIKKMKCK